MRGLAKLRWTLTLVVALVVTLEVLHWARPLLVEARAGSLPTLIVGAGGKTWFRRYETRPGGRKPDDLAMFAVDFDADGRKLRETELKRGEPNLEGAVHPQAFGRWRKTVPGDRFHELLTGRFEETRRRAAAVPTPDAGAWKWSWGVALEQWLTSAQHYSDWRFAPDRATNRTDEGRRWKFRDDRLVCVEGPAETVVGWFGPDRYSEGAPPPDAPRFDAETRWVGPRRREPGQDAVVALVEPERRDLVLVAYPDKPSLARFDRDGFQPPPEREFAVAVTNVKAESTHGEPPREIPPFDPLRREIRLETVYEGRPFASDEGIDDAPDFYFRAGGDLLLVRRDGKVRRAPLDSDETALHRWPRPDVSDAEPGLDPDVLTTLLPPLDPARPRFRVRQWKADGTLLQEDVRAPLVTTYSVAADVVGHAASIVRPPVLTAASFVLPGPTDFHEYSGRWLLDADVAGGRSVGWLAASLVTAAVCAAFARRRARLFSPSARHVLLWTLVGAALGVVGVIWMEIVARRSHVVRCACGRRRAVHVEACPACAAEWPAPTPTGIEVFG